MTMKKVFLFFLLSGFFLLVSFAEEPAEPVSKRFADRFYYGGSFGFQLGPINRIEIAPTAGFRITPAWSTGLGVRYIYYRDKRIGNNFDSHIWSGSLFTDLVLVKDLDKVLPFRMSGSFFIHGELEMLNLPTRDFNSDPEATGTRFWQPGYILAAGLRQSLGKRSYLFIMVGYNFNDSDRLPYDNPFIRFGLIL